MSAVYLSLIFGVITGASVMWLFKALRFAKHFAPKGDLEKAIAEINELKRDLSVEQNTVSNLGSQLEKASRERDASESGRQTAVSGLAAKSVECATLEKQLEDQRREKEALQKSLEEKSNEISGIKDTLSTVTAEKGSLVKAHESLKEERAALADANGRLLNEIKHASTGNATLTSQLNSLQESYSALNARFEATQKQLDGELRNSVALQKEIVGLSEQNRVLQENLGIQKAEIERIQKEFKTEFQLIANALLEEKSVKFTNLNKETIDNLLKPLSENIQGFRQKVEEAYSTEAKERHSLAGELKKLFELNQRLSDEATNLANALKGNSKAQGDWGQMILENLLENSGLQKGRDYLVQEFLKDADGNYLKNEAGNKMQPDVIVNYPDNRKVLIDAKVSLSAYLRYIQEDDPAIQADALQDHLRSIRRHIDDLSEKHYHEFASTLDFVMMFVPNEAAYCCAMTAEPELWQYAYSKKVLLISPTNLLVALKMAADIWRREYQTRNAIDIANRGAALYDKFVGFIESLREIGQSLEKATRSYTKAYGQLKDGNGNLVRQAELLRDLGVKTKKNIPQDLIEGAEPSNEGREEFQAKALPLAEPEIG